jgi:hypothetical protein
MPASFGAPVLAGAAPREAIHDDAVFIPEAERVGEGDNSEASTEPAGGQHRRLRHADDREIEMLTGSEQAGLPNAAMIAASTEQWCSASISRAMAAPICASVRVAILGTQRGAVSGTNQVPTAAAYCPAARIQLVMPRSCSDLERGCA